MLINIGINRPSSDFGHRQPGCARQFTQRIELFLGQVDVCPDHQSLPSSAGTGSASAGLLGEGVGVEAAVVAVAVAEGAVIVCGVATACLDAAMAASRAAWSASLRRASSFTLSIRAAMSA